ncbi:MAG: hypothetical protein H6R15_2707 [Proteobacteria bacterium]|nr:hypothetical protein [Pseudomonadota bacterium]
MSDLISELQRLYFLSDQQWLSQESAAGGEAVCTAAGDLTPEVVGQGLAGRIEVRLKLVDAGDRVRALVLGFARASDWPRVAELYQAVQDDLDLPAPALAVSGQNGFRLWFSLAEPVPVGLARAFLDGLRCKYLADMPLAKLELRPDAGSPAVVKLTPALHRATGKWSAFIDPSLGGMFVDEPGLEMAPSMNQQAHILAGLAGIKAGEFARVLHLLQSPAVADAGDAPKPALDVPASPAAPSSRLDVGHDFSDPQSFLLAVMNDPMASAGQRIRAAKALLPYFAKGQPK